MAVGLPLKTTYANGDVYSASDVNDTNGTVNLVGQTLNRYAAKNVLINGGLDVWQRGTTYTGAAGAYITADRWYMYSSTSCTFARETTTIPSGCQYSMKITVGASAANIQGYQAIETLNAVQYAGQNVALSMNFQASVSTSMTITLEYSTTVDQGLAVGGWVAITATSGGTGTATTGSFATISGVYAIPSTAKSIRVSFATVGTMASAAILYWGKAMLELGSTVTTFARAGGTIQNELAACQRYYIRYIAGPYTTAGYYNTTQLYPTITFPVEMRIAPTAIGTSAAGALVSYVNGSARTSTALAFNAATTKTLNITMTTSSATAGQAGGVDVVSTQWVEMSAEL